MTTPATTLEALRDEVIAASDNILLRKTHDQHAFIVQDKEMYALAKARDELDRALAPQELVTDAWVVEPLVGGYVMLTCPKKPGLRVTLNPDEARDLSRTASLIGEALTLYLTAALAVGGNTRDAVLATENANMAEVLRVLKLNDKPEFSRKQVELLIELLENNAAALKSKPAPTPPENSEAGWIEWCGGKCPVPGMSVEYKMRNSSNIIERAFPANNLRWSHYETKRGGGDIIAYRVIQAPTPPERSADTDEMPTTGVELVAKPIIKHHTPQAEPSELDAQNFIIKLAQVSESGERLPLTPRVIDAVAIALKSIWPTPRPVSGTQAKMGDDQLTELCKTRRNELLALPYKANNWQSWDALSGVEKDCEREAMRQALSRVKAYLSAGPASLPPPLYTDRVAGTIERLYEALKDNPLMPERYLSDLRIVMNWFKDWVRK